MVTARKGKTLHRIGSIRVDGKMVDDVNNFQHSLSNRIKRLQHIIILFKKRLANCDRITDKTLLILFPMTNIRSCPALSNNDAASFESSSSLMKHRSQTCRAFVFASSWCET